MEHKSEMIEGPEAWTRFQDAMKLLVFGSRSLSLAAASTR